MPYKHTASNYIIHLDGILPFAVAAVILGHWASELTNSHCNFINSIDFAGLGIECYFILSGFLIMLILLAKNEMNLIIKTAPGHFQMQRALRIFPSYYVVLLPIFFVLPEQHDIANWHALNFSNLYPLWHDTFSPIGHHYWSLSVAENYYLLWTVIVLALPI